MDAAIAGVKYPEVAEDAEDEVPTEDAAGTEDEAFTEDTAASKDVFSITDKRLLVAGIILALVILAVKIYLERTVALFYYDEQNRYHSLGRVGYRRTGKGYHVEIGSGIRRKTSTDRYRIRTTKNMRKAAKNAHLFVRISSQVLKLGLEEYVDFAL